MKLFFAALLFASCFLSGLSAAPQTIEFGGVTFVLKFAHPARSANETAMNLYIREGDTVPVPSASIEVVHWPKAKSSVDAARDWLRLYAAKLVDKPKTYPVGEGKDARDFILEAMTFFSKPAGQRVLLRRFIHDKDGKGVTSYLYSESWLETDGKIGDTAYLAKHDELIKQLGEMNLPIETAVAK
ncbi:MAG TPA: hypothetical protein VF388_05115 [Lacunisphaera sp.]|jgi:hypothetical protein